MRQRRLVVIAFACACAPDPGRGRMEALAPILGGGARTRAPVTPSSEPVEDYWTDLRDLQAAWPSAAYELPHLIRAVIARGTWIDEHHNVANAGSGLQVRHRPEVVREAKKLVRNLRAMLIRPVDIDVAFIEQPAQRELGRIALSSYGGQWTTAERMTNQAVLAGVGVEDGSIVPKSVTLASGITVQAAAWRWGEDRAVVAFTGLVTGEVPKGVPIAQEVHRALPQKNKDARDWEAHEVKLELPVRSLVEAQVQVAVPRGKWTEVAVVPIAPGRTCAVRVRVEWASGPPALERIDPLSGKGFVLESIPIALPTEARAALGGELEFDNRRSIDDNAAGWLKQRAQTSAESQKRATYNFQEESGTLDLGVATQSVQGFRKKGGPAPADGPNVPEALEAMSAEIMNAEWPEGTALEFVGNHVFVVHSPALTAKLRALLERTHEWSNRVVPVEITLVAGEGGPPILPPAKLSGRPGSWSNVFAGEMHAVLAAAWPADRPSPPVQVFWRGTRAGFRQPDGGSPAIDLRFRSYTLEKLDPARIAKAVLQLPQDAVWSLDRRLEMAPGKSLSTGLVGGAGESQAVLVTMPAR